MKLEFEANGDHMAATSTLDEILDWLYADDPLADAAVAARARLLLLDTIGCFIAAQAKPEPAALARQLGDLDPGRVELPGVEHALAPGAAAFAIALGACWDEACEGLARAHGRPGLHAIPPAVALGLANEHDLATALRAIVTGYEVGGRMGEALRIRPGMHVDGAWGALAAAAAASRILGGDSAQCATAIRTAACQVPFSLYAPVAAGATARNTYVGHGAALGLLAAIAASAGVTAPEDAIAAYGEIALGGPVPDLAPTGEHLILEGYLKPFAAVRHVHYGAQCALDWRAAHGADTSAITEIGLKVYDEAIQYCGNRDPRSAIQAQFSLSYGLAHALVAGDLGPEAYTAGALADPESRRLEALIEIEVDEALTGTESRGATLTVIAGETQTTTTVTTVAGDPDNPPGEAAVRAKFSRYAAAVIGEDLAGRIADGVLGAPLDTALSSVLPGR